MAPLATIVHEALDRFERTRYWIAAFTIVAVVVDLIIVAYSWRWLSPWYQFAPLVVAPLTILFCWLLRRRTYLTWRAEQLAATIRSPEPINVRIFFGDTLRFRNFVSVWLLWAIFAVVLYPYDFGPSERPMIALARGFFEAVRPNSIATLWEVHATILGIFLVLLAFVFQFVGLKMAYETSLLPFLMRRAQFLPILATNFFFILVDAYTALENSKSEASIILRYVAVMGLIFGVISALFLLHRVFDMLEPDTLQEGLSALVRRDVLAQLREEQYSEIAGYLLTEECSRLGLLYSRLDPARNIPSIRADESGVISEVYLDKLAQFAKSLSQRLPSSDGPPDRALIVRGLGDEVTEGRTTLARVCEVDLSAEHAELLRRVFMVTIRAPRTPRTETKLRRSLGVLRDQGLQAIDAESPDLFGKIIRKHIDLLEDYLAARSRFRIVLQRHRPMLLGMLGFESMALYEICRSLEELIRRAFQSRTEAIIAKATYGLIEGLSSALTNGAYPVYERLLGLVNLCFGLCLFFEDTDLRYRVLERICANQNDFASYGIDASAFEGPATGAGSLKEYGRALLNNFNRPLKLALDRGDEKAFAVMFSALSLTFTEHVRDSEFELRNISSALEYRVLSPAARADFERQRDVLRLKVEFHQEVTKTKNELRYGLGGWSVRLYQANKLQTDKFAQIFPTVCHALGSFEVLASLALDSGMELSDRYGWSFWELEDQPGFKGGAVALPSTTWLARFYVLASSRLAPVASDEQRLYQKLLHDSVSSASIAVMVQNFRDAGNSILKHPEKWKVAVPELTEQPTAGREAGSRASDGLDRLYAFWDTLVNRLRSDEEVELLRASVSDSTIDALATEIKKSWAESSPLRAMAKAFGLFDDQLDIQQVPEDVAVFGLNPLLEDKQWFVEGQEYATRAVGRHLGESLGASESAFVFERIAARLDPVLVDTLEKAREMLDSYIHGIPEADYELYVIIIDSMQTELAVKLYMSNDFERAERTGTDTDVRGFFVNRYKKIPIVQIRGRVGDASCTLICCRPKTVGIWRQFWAGSKGNELELKVNQIDEEKARELVTKNPLLAKTEGGDPLKEEAAILALRKKVHIEVRERFEFELSEQPLAIRIDLTVHPDPNGA
jgi:hypothetical protein